MRGCPAPPKCGVRRARTRIMVAAARFRRFMELLSFDWYKLPPKRFDALKCDFSRKIWKYIFFFVHLQPNK